MKLRPPRRKRCCKNHPGKPFPIIETISGPYKFSGRFNGIGIVIESTFEINKIHSMGFFGKASYSRSFSTFNNKNTTVLLRERQYQNRKQWLNKNPEIFNTYEEKNVIVLEDSDGEKDYFNNLQPELRKQRDLLNETLNLTLEEAYFLLNALKCLNIKDGDNKLLDDISAWRLFTNTQENFIQNYIAYYYFRSRNWVVKPGLKFGGDFLLYKDGPPFYHASYLVIIDVIKISSNERNSKLCKRSMDWTSLIGLNRLTETAAKELLICQVFWPSDMSFEEVKISHEVLNKFSVNSVIMKRWISKQERSSKT